MGEGETLGLVMLGSDKTHLNNNYGDKHVHAVYMSCGNIDKEVRMKLSSRAWVMVAQIPVVKFLEKNHQGYSDSAAVARLLGIRHRGAQEMFGDAEVHG